MQRRGHSFQGAHVGGKGHNYGHFGDTNIRDVILNYHFSSYPLAHQRDVPPANLHHQTLLYPLQSIFRAQVSSLFDLVKEKVFIVFRGRILRPPRPSPNGYADLFDTHFFSTSVDHFESHQEKIQSGTCGWIRNTPEYIQWFHAENYQLLWLTGNAGMGKSTLMAYIVATIRGSSETSAALHCFCDDVTTPSVSSIISAAIHQLIRGSDVLRDLAMSKDSTCVIEKGRSDVKGPSRKPEDLWDLLCKVVQGSHLKRVYLVVDGLDDCSSEVQRGLMKLFNDGPHKLSVIVASQPLEELHLALWNDHESLRQKSKMQNLDASFYDTEINADIQRFLEWRVITVGKKRGWTTIEKDKVLRHLSTQKAGIFLPFVLCLEDFEHTETRDVTENLEDLFINLTSLDKTYEKLIKAMSKKLQDRPSDVLEYVIYAQRPMKVAELAFACSYNTTITLRHDLRLFGPMLRVKHANNTVDDAEDTVDFIHPSARRFFVEQVLKKEKPIERFVVQPHRAHCDLARLCLLKLQLCSRDNYPAWYEDNRATNLLKITQGRVFLSYAFDHWHHHVRIALDDEETDAKSMAEVRRLLKEIAHVFSEPGRKNFAHLLGIRNDAYVFAIEISDISILEFYASLGSSVMVDEWLEQNRHDLAQYEARGIFDSALRIATYVGHLQTTVKLIQYCHYDLFQQEEWLHYVRTASQSGNKLLLRRLLEMSGRSPLLLAGAAIAACLSNKHDVLDVLTENYELLTERDAMGMTVLHRLATCPTGSSVFTRDALTRACRYFIDKGLDPNSRDSFGNTIMHHICWDISKCYKDLIESVHGMGASLHLSNNLGCMPLHFAVCRGLPNVLAYFIERLGNKAVQISSNGGLTPLHWAMSRRFSNYSFEDDFIIVRQLLLRGAKLDAVSRSGRTPFSIACETPFMLEVLSLVFYRLDGIDNMHESLLQFVTVWTEAKTIEDIWFGLLLPKRLSSRVLRNFFEEVDSDFAISANRFRILNELHPRLLMLHLQKQYTPNDDELEQRKAQSSKAAEKPNRSSQELPQRPLLFYLIEATLGENESDEENDIDNPDEQTAHSDVDNDASRRGDSASRATTADTSHSTRAQIVAKSMEIVKIWFMTHSIFDKDIVEDGDLALAQILLQIKAGLLYRASGELTGTRQANDKGDRHDSATQNEGKEDDDEEKHHIHNAKNDKDDAESAHGQTDDSQSKDTGPEHDQKTLDDEMDGLTKAMVWWTVGYKNYFCARSSEAIAQERHKPIYQIDARFYNSVQRLFEYDRRVANQEGGTEGASGAEGGDSEQEGMPSVNTMAVRQASFRSAHSAQLVELSRHRRILRRPEEIKTWIRKKLGGKSGRSPQPAPPVLGP